MGIKVSHNHQLGGDVNDHWAKEEERNIRFHSNSSIRRTVENVLSLNQEHTLS